MSTPREEILERACELFTEEGLEGLSMRRLAESVGVTAPALYRHFDGKDDVLGSVLGEAYNVLARYLYDALSGSSPMERMTMAGEAYLNFALDHPRYYETLTAPLETLGIEEAPEGVTNQARAIDQFWHDRLRELMDAGVLRKDDPHRISLTMWAHAHGLISLYLRGMMGEMDADEFREVYRDSSTRVMLGIASEEGAAMVAESRSPTPDGERSIVPELGQLQASSGGGDERRGGGE